MPLIKSAIKRVRKTKRQTQQNLISKNKFKSLIKEFLALAKDKKIEEAAKLFPQVQKAIDLAVKKNLIHANTGARKKSNLSKLIAKSGISKIKAVVTKPTIKKEAKPSPVKKAIVKKTTKKK